MQLVPARRKALTVPLVLASALAVIAGCSGGDDETVATTTAPPAAETSTTETSTTEPQVATTVPETTQPATTVPPTTVPEVTPQDLLEGDWAVIRTNVVDDGFWNFGDFDVVENRRYTVTCADGDCETPGIVSTAADGTKLEPFEATFVDGVLRFEAVLPYPCLNAAGTAYDGPEEAEYTSVLELEPDEVDDDGVVASLSGRFRAQIVAEASDECSAESVSYTADMFMFRPDLAPLAEITDGVISGEAAGGLTERGFSGCDAGGCVLRIPIDSVGVDGTEGTFLDVELAVEGDGSYVGTTTYVGTCLSDVDGSFVAEGGYDVTLDVVAASFEVPGLETPVVLIEEIATATTSASLPPEQAAVCASYEVPDFFGGVSTDIPSTIDFSAPAVNGPSAGSGVVGYDGSSVTDAAALADAIGSASLAAFEPTSYGVFDTLDALVGDQPTGGTIEVIGPFDTTDGRGIVALSVLDVTGTCALRAIIDGPTGPQFYVVDVASAECSATDAFDGFNAGSATER